MPRGQKPKGEKGNQQKQLSYARSWGKIRKALGTQHYSEAINLEESIIRDRLLSYLCRVGKLDPSDPRVKHRSLHQLIKLWRNQVKGPISDRFYSDLQGETDEWRKRRNRIHEAVVSLPGEEHGDHFAYESEIQQTAIDGERLAKSIQNWYRREKDAIAKGSRSDR